MEVMHVTSAYFSLAIESDEAPPNLKGLQESALLPARRNTWSTALTTITVLRGFSELVRLPSPWFEVSTKINEGM